MCNEKRQQQPASQAAWQPGSQQAVDSQRTLTDTSLKKTQLKCLTASSSCSSRGLVNKAMAAAAAAAGVEAVFAANSLANWYTNQAPSCQLKIAFVLAAIDDGFAGWLTFSCRYSSSRHAPSTGVMPHTYMLKRVSVCVAYYLHDNWISLAVTKLTQRQVGSDSSYATFACTSVRLATCAAATGKESLHCITIGQRSHLFCTQTHVHTNIYMCICIYLNTCQYLYMCLLWHISLAKSLCCTVDATHTRSEINNAYAMHCIAFHFFFGCQLYIHRGNEGVCATLHCPLLLLLLLAWTWCEIRGNSCRNCKL